MEERLGKHRKEQPPRERALSGISTHSDAPVIKTVRYLLMGKQNRPVEKNRLKIDLSTYEV